MQFFVIQQKADKAGLTLSEYARQSSIYGQIKPRWSPEERDIFKKLIMMSNDLHQIAMMAKKKGALTCLLHFEKYRDHIDYAIEQLRKGQ